VFENKDEISSAMSEGEFPSASLGMNQNGNGTKGRAEARLGEDSG
jgi:hypothetical protein